MQIISHRGFWSNKALQNSLDSFRESFIHSFGIETDIRGGGGGRDLLISHDAIFNEKILLEDVFKLYKDINSSLPLALNIKCDGLQILLKELLEKYEIHNYFVFDMSLPDTLGYINCGLNVFTRQSEYEREPSLYDKACGVWLDCFFSSWIDRDTIERHLNNHKKVCIVSPELHGREHSAEWESYLRFPSDVMLCTDYPKEADIFFNKGGSDD